MLIPLQAQERNEAMKHPSYRDAIFEKLFLLLHFKQKHSQRAAGHAAWLVLLLQW